MVRQRSGLPLIVAIGAGNVASHIIPALEAAGVGEVAQVYSRTIRSANALVSRLWNASATDNLDLIIPDADIYVVSLVDSAVKDVVAKLKSNNALWVHTSGSLPLSVLSGLSPRTGVFYPLQTFSRSTALNVADVPLFIEGSTPGVEAQIREIGEKVFEKVIHADSQLRKKMHVAAVFACNFTNYLWTVADDLLKKEGLDLSVLFPLLNETLRKAETIHGGPAAGQTGPAVRGDDEVMKSHRDMLPKHLATIYQMLSEAINDRHKS
ncbi:MAG: DUF2520 domain-containing protein [Muribaculaceae bacterium]|nr:DUF2520 domain-containing protein [Muribaculaceae bacterium]